MEEQVVASETGREEKLLNDETICAVKLLDQTSTNRRTSSMATGSVTKREATISLNTPIFFSPFLSHDPPPFPNYKAWCIYHWVNTNKKSTQTNAQNTEQPHGLLIAQTTHINCTDTINIHTCNPTRFADIHTGTQT